MNKNFKKYEHFLSSSWNKVACFPHSCRPPILSFFRIFLFQINPFWIQLTYFIFLSLVGFLALKFLKPKSNSFKPNNLDVFFTSVSASTVSSMSTVEMEVFSNAQLIIMTILMLVGGEVFTSALGLLFLRFKTHNSSNSVNSSDQIEMGFITDHHHPGSDGNRCQCDGNNLSTDGNSVKSSHGDSLKYLGYVVLGYLFVVLVVGSTLVFLYTSLVSDAEKTLKNKGIQISTFSVFTTISSFSNCGFIPTNENMIIFKKNSGLLLLLISQILIGNTLYPPCLRFLIWVLEKKTKRGEFSYMLRKSGEMGYSHLLSGFRCFLLVVSVLGFVLVQFVMFLAMEWRSEGMEDMKVYQKIVGSLFQTVNSRHAGESVVDIAVVSPAILVLFVFMMYLPPYTSFLPTNDYKKVQRKGKESRKQRKTLNLVECLMFSQLSCLTICIILICITERRKMKEDPINFSVLNITIEVISAFGNVGFSTGYSCKRQLKLESSCIDKWTGFAGRWSPLGKFILIFVMFFGRLKKFTLNAGQAWNLS